ncbi:hypothetical protein YASMINEVIRUS_686 [Yasminevirus sp. GU-2018]|uniref:Transmembrane protein n=1 Tax=Yasminevirus sp. GU-2018 TaxID=2420051 RepID=A0A5K0U9W5_9VIRU|nr:hypothetical protein YASMINEVIRUS_686 [Yasminevirus sp. GU-2018]
MANEGVTLAAAIITVIINAFAFAVGIAEAVYVSKYDEYKDGCSGIWGWMVAACVIDISIPVLTCCGLTTLFNKEEDNKNSTLNLLHIGSFVIAIWSAVTYFNLSTSCYDYWQSTAPELWTFIMIHFVLLWIGVGLIGLLIVLGILVCCLKS